MITRISCQLSYRSLLLVDAVEGSRALVAGQTIPLITHWNAKYEETTKYFAQTKDLYRMASSQI